MSGQICGTYLDEGTGNSLSNSFIVRILVKAESHEMAKDNVASLLDFLDNLYKINDEVIEQYWKDPQDFTVSLTLHTDASVDLEKLTCLIGDGRSISNRGGTAVLDESYGGRFYFPNIRRLCIQHWAP